MTDIINLPGSAYYKYGLSHGAATKDYVFAGGMALDHTTNLRHPDAVTIADETRMVLEEIRQVLELAGATLADVVKTTCFLSDEAYRVEFWTTYKEVFGEGPYPARSTFVVGIAAGCRVEIDAIAYRPGRRG
jgi:enamine deaminase RidA (YjgF/YER057c/UK114 family)